MNAKRHALVARLLIEACGGLNEAAAVDDCRLKKSRLGLFQDPNGGHFMPADVMGALEAYCGEPIYSRALVESRPAATHVVDLAEEVCDTVEEAAELQALVRKYRGKEFLPAAQRHQVERFLEAMEDHIRGARGTVHRAVVA